MIDYFALLEQPRGPWLDPVALKEVYHRKTLQTHPDAAATSSEHDFARLNEAYQVLQDPRRRLHHLLSLENCAPLSADQTIPLELQELFLRIGELSQRANRLLEKIRMASNALSRSLLRPELAQMQKEVAELRKQIENLLEAATAQLRETNPNWRRENRPVTVVSNLYFQFAYLGRWAGQLDELAFQLSLL